jgi:hypothetical protein
MKKRYAFFLCSLLFSCESQVEKEHRLAHTYCSSCHLFPEPALLDKGTWEADVLPQMALRMGVDLSLLSDVPHEDLDEVMKTIPDKPMVTEEEWRLISQYFIKNAPDQIETRPLTDLPEQSQFDVLPHSLRGNQFITLVKFDSAYNKLFVGNRFARLYALDENLTVSDSFQLDSPPSDMMFQRDTPLVLTMGIMDPNDQTVGNLSRLSISGRNGQVLLDSLKRPVHIAMDDLDHNGETDYVISCFGNYTGYLLAIEKKGDQLLKHIVHNLPGTRKVEIKDFNNDGLNDIIALITQGDEQLTVFINEGNFKFTPQRLLRFSPVYGSSYFEIADMNSDGHTDIIYTNGDNADYSMILKPYHGIRIFLNDGKDQYNESWFHPMHGASKTVVRDFDQDDDMDIAAISFFPDFQDHPEQSFLYFNNENGKLQPQITPLGSAARWLIMEAADIDRDQDDDLVLGALNFPGDVPQSLIQKWKKNSTALLIFRNQKN